MEEAKIYKWHINVLKNYHPDFRKKTKFYGNSACDMPTNKSSNTGIKVFSICLILISSVPQRTLGSLRSMDFI